MMRGRVDVRNNRASAPAATPASVDPERAASPPAGGHQATRPATLANLAKAPATSASADAASSLSRRVALPVAPDDPGVVLNKALKRIGVWKGLLIAGREPGARAWSPEETVQYAGPVMESARTGLSALAALKMQGRTTDSYADETESMLLAALAKASSDVLNVRDDMVKERWGQQFVAQVEVAETAEIASDPAEDPEPDFRLLPGWLGDLEQIRDVLDDIARRFKSDETSGVVRAQLRKIMPAVSTGQSICRTAMQMVQGTIISGSAVRLSVLATQKGLPDVVERLRALQQACHHRREEVAAASSALEAEADESWMRRRGSAQAADRPTLQALIGHHDVLQEYGARLDQVGLDLCLDAAAMIEMHDADGLWQYMMGIAHAISGYREGLQALCRAAGRVRPPRAEPPPLQAAEPLAAAGSAEPSGNARHKGDKPVKRPGVTFVAAPALLPAPVDKRTDTQKTADALLKRYPVDRGTVSQFGGDLIRIAQWLGHDTRTLQSDLKDPRRDGAKTADYLRSAAQDWFGDAGRIGLLHDARAALPSKDARVGQLTGRIKAWERIERRLDTLEADLLKRDACPRAPHLDRLLNAKENQIRFVGQPVRLPAETRNDRQGTLFEMRVELKPFSDGRQAAPWVVHIHTREPTTADALSTKPFSDFTAVHLKTEREKNLGPRWEAVMRALGYADAKVHRGPIGTALLGKLFARAKPPGNRGMPPDRRLR